ncbi:hypothetical protein QBZ16_000801 [Prototheca wickerhamii]|uniref:Uncharacterized protein n=1 Tax=Prototheca wickerhamii TaxID=3111 RepID=A0AAD9IPR4_PROWI|nr:hypothetical protein QBZ16_000801 [Prototheca wickerhamii]
MMRSSVPCPPDTTWLLVTNGDNEYASDFLMRVNEESRADPAADIVAFDFYSRYQRPTAPQCERFAAGAAPVDGGSGPLLCKRNRLRWCHTDLGSFVLRYRRFVEERQAFGAETRPGNEMEMAPEHSDGLLAGALIAQGWRAARVTDRCLFSHSPSPQACAWQGGTWDDRDMMTWQAGGGVCLESQEDAAWVLANDPNAEMVTVDVSNDGNVVA